MYMDSRKVYMDSRKYTASERVSQEDRRVLINGLERELSTFTGFPRVVAKGTLRSASCPAFVLPLTQRNSASAQGSFVRVGDPEHQF